MEIFPRPEAKVNLIIIIIFIIISIAGVDFDASPVSLTFRPGGHSISANIRILDDQILEALNETFQVTLLVVGMNNSRVRIRPASETTTITIMDDDCEFKY